MYSLGSHPWSRSMRIRKVSNKIASKEYKDIGKQISVSWRSCYTNTKYALFDPFITFIS